MKANVTLLVLALTLVGGSLFGQCKQWKWPADGTQKALAEEKYVLHNDLVKNKQFKQAIPAHQWLLTNTPDLQSAIYINGEKIFTNLADQAETPEQLNVYVDSLMLIYDMRLQYCPTSSVYDRKALYAFKYWYKDDSKLETILDFYDTNYEKRGAKMMDSNIKYHMTAVQLNSLKLKNLTEEQILDYYDKLGGIVNQKKAAKPENTKKYDAIQANLDEILGTLVEFDCAKTKEILGPKFKANPDDVDIANKIFKFMLQGKCTDDPLWLEAGKVVFEQSPDFGIAKNLGLKSKASGDTESAVYYFAKAVELANNAGDKAEMHIQLGHIDREKGAKSSARGHYRDALSADPNAKDAYDFIGILYMTSFEDCAKKVNRVEDRAVFLAAYKMFRLAGNSSRMAEAKAQFPSVGEIFELNMQKGQSITVGCWINETVTLDTRD